MPLSEHEQRLLSQMEQQLLNDDPKFASAMKGSTRRAASAGRFLLGGAGILVGILLLVVGVATQQVAVGVIAFVLMLVGAGYAISTPKRGTGGPVGVVRPDGTPGPRPAGDARPTGRRARPTRPSSGPAAGGSFMQRMEERWQKRRDEGGGR